MSYSDNWTIFRVIGAIIIFVGLYLVLWGKSKDQLGSKSFSKKKKTRIEVRQWKDNTSSQKCGYHWWEDNDFKSRIYDHQCDKFKSTNGTAWKERILYTYANI